MARTSAEAAPVPSAVKVLQCLAVLDELNEPATFAQITERSGLARSTTRRMLAFLREFG